ncbi:alpha-hydroxy-acid oxidizing protein [Kribbella antibiotica]|uniref:Alpha-hydroxy-acid oxidizing protein n=1 Tax=Kribbella antibiotica TaxID=190195 RepID=A0A4R4ZG93_9ACTN|nr:alpha-hydroxy acid oxidase [Kribbella antibiotica]TDD57611.1 alpha-hydroxy-acid oxidizing protein [Kribbella antibiotica]
MADAFNDYEQLAVLPAGVRDFVAGGSGAELTLRRNRAALDAVTVTPRVLGGVGCPDTATTILGTAATLPIAVAPMAYQRLFHPEGELLLAAAAGSAGIPYVISTLSSLPLEKIAAVAPSWFQLYWLRDRTAVRALIDRATEAGCGALMVTVDVPVMGRRLRDVRNSFTLPPDVIAANLVDKSTEAHSTLNGASAVAAHTATAFDPAFSWRDLAWLRSVTEIPLLVKGILDPRDALAAVDAGADSVVVSNHGGRQFDGAPASIDALGSVVDALGNDFPVLLDSGIRGGTDVLKALAVGADAVLVGRPLLWALAVGAPDEALALLGRELRDAMLLAGCADLAAVADLATERNPWPIS